MTPEDKKEISDFLIERQKTLDEKLDRIENRITGEKGVLVRLGVLESKINLLAYIGGAVLGAGVLVFFGMLLR